MRIIAGTARRTTLAAPQGLNTRPTSDMAKEGLFNIISAEINGARFLDLFCGSGAVGLEALSRGAKEAVFVDSHRAAIQATKENVQKTHLHEKAEIMHCTVAQAIGKLSATGRVFDIIFLDPPYETSLVAETLQLLYSGNLLAQSGMIIAETDSQFLPVNSPFPLYNTREYGRSTFLFYT